MDLSKDRSDPHGVQALLAVLRAKDTAPSPAPPDDAQVPPPPSTSEPSQPSSTPEPARQDAPRSTSSPEDLRYISFSQALTHLNRLSQDVDFLDAILLEKAKQDETERQIVKDRKAFASSLGISEGALDDEALDRFDRQALVRWDEVLEAQQRQFEQLGVPCFFVTRDAAQLRKQERIFNTLSSLLEG